MRSVPFVFAASLMVLACSSDDDGGGTGTGGSGAGGSGTGGVGAFGASGGQAGSAGAATGGVGASGGAGGTAAAGGTGATGGGAGAACTQCIQGALTGACSSQLAACQGSADCQAIFTCGQGCPANDSACIQGCINSNPNGKAAFDAITACINTTCKTECGF